MNIFSTSNDPEKSAYALDDRRLVKMVLETTQILSTVARRYGAVSDLLYKQTHQNHPCAGESVVNYVWLTLHGMALAREYERRFERQHKSASLYDEIERAGVLLPYVPATPLPNVTGYPDLPREEAYRRCLRDKWDADTAAGRPPKWTWRGRPSWAPVKNNRPPFMALPLIGHHGGAPVYDWSPLVSSVRIGEV